MLPHFISRARFLVLTIVFAAGLLRAAEPYGLDHRPPIGAFLNGALPSIALVQTGNWAVVEAFTNLTVDDPTMLVPEPGTNRLYVSTRQGQIFWFVNDPSTKKQVEFLNLTNVTQGWDDCGLLGFALHPDFGKAGSPNRGFVYVWYHYSPSPLVGPKRPPVDTPGYNRLSRFIVPDGSLVADRSTEQVLINQYDHNLWHEGSGIAFGPDGFLYLSLSDEGSSYDFYKNTQTLKGKMFSGVLRIDVNCDPKLSHPIRRQPQPELHLAPGFTENNYTAHYFIPNDNPFLDPQGGLMEEFWCVGLRNPHRMTFDRTTGRIWVGDVGQDTWEEVDIIERGGNYQWAYMEAFHPVIRNGVPKTKPPPEEYIGIEKPPIYEYQHGTVGKCVIGGYVYRGAQYAKELGGKYIFGDNGSGKIWAMTWDGTKPATVEYLCNMPPGQSYTGLSSFGIDQQDELYICKMGRPSRIYKLIHADKLARPLNITFKAPERLSWFGAFTDLRTMTPAEGLIPYDVNTPLWSDGAVKHRWIAVPTNKTSRVADTKIGYSPTSDWNFPAGTVFVKHFDMTVNETNGATRRLETRFLVRDEKGGVYGVTYKWRENNSDADLVSIPSTESIRITNAAGIHMQTWYYPSPIDCLVCHNPNAHNVLGVKARQLNREYTYAETGVTDNQLRTWNHLGLFNPSLDESTLAKIPTLVRVDDPHASLENRVRSYIDANCSQCHRPNGVPGYFDARFETPFSGQGLVDGRLANSMDIPDSRVVSAGNLSKSILNLRITTNGVLQMPPLAKNIVDTNAVDTIHQWIEGLPHAVNR